MSIFQANRKAKYFATICTALAGLSASSAYGANGPKVELVATGKISIYDLWSTLSPQKAVSGDFVATYWPYDSESAHYVGKQKICGILLLGSPDTGSRPSGFEVRSTKCNYSFGSQKSNASAFYLRDDMGGKEVIRISSDGRISVRNKFLGNIELEELGPET